MAVRPLKAGGFGAADGVGHAISRRRMIALGRQRSEPSPGMQSDEERLVVKALSSMAARGRGRRVRRSR